MLVFFNSKKGMSPLIATVLLIAFAVAMGAMIMNWSSSLGENTADKPDCSGINLVMNPIICHTDNLIRLSLRNQGSEIEELTLRISDANIENDINLKNSKLSPGEELNREIPFVKTSPTYIGIIPAVQHQGLSASCKAPIIEINDVARCSS